MDDLKVEPKYISNLQGMHFLNSIYFKKSKTLQIIILFWHLLILFGKSAAFIKS
jgi:hypothetical protein